MNYDQIQSQFLTYYKTEPQLRKSLQQTVDRIKENFFDKRISGGDEFHDAAHFAFMEINEIIVSRVCNEETWKEVENIFNYTMKRGPTSGERPLSEAWVITQFQRLAEFGYLLVVNNKEIAERNSVDIWRGVKDFYRNFY